MAFVITKTGTAYKELLKTVGIDGDLEAGIKGVKRKFWDNLFGGANDPGGWGAATKFMGESELVLKADKLASILIGKEKDAVILEEYTGKALEGRFFLFVEYKDFNAQERRGLHGYGNMVLSTRGPLKFINSQNLPDINMPGVGPVSMDMGPKASYINFEGSFMFNSPEESAAWLENRMKGGSVFIFHYKNYHRYVKIARFNYEHIKDDLINYEVGLKFLSYDTEDVTNVIEDSKKKTRLEEFAVAEMMGRLQLVLADIVGGVTGINNLADFISDVGDQVERWVSIASGATNGLLNSSNVLQSNNIFAQLGNQSDKIKKTISNASADLTKAANFAGSANDLGNQLATGIRNITGL